MSDFAKSQVLQVTDSSYLASILRGRDVLVEFGETVNGGTQAAVYVIAVDGEVFELIGMIQFVLLEHLEAVTPEKINTLEGVEIWEPKTALH